MTSNVHFIFDENQTNMIEPTQALFDDGYAENATPTSSNINWLFHYLSINRAPVGEYMDYPALVSPAPTGWLYCDGTTIGSAGSGASSADDNYQDLFVFLWTNDASVVVAPSKGASAAADWTANKTITLPNHPGRNLVMKSTTVGSIFNAPAGTLVGAETTTLLETNLPQIQPTITDPGHPHDYDTLYDTAPGTLTGSTGNAGQAGGESETFTRATTTNTTGITIDPFGGDPSNLPNALPHSIVQTSAITYRLIKW